MNSFYNRRAFLAPTTKRAANACTPAPQAATCARACRYKYVRMLYRPVLRFSPSLRCRAPYRASNCVAVLILHCLHRRVPFAVTQSAVFGSDGACASIAVSQLFSLLLLLLLLLRRLCLVVWIHAVGESLWFSC